MLNKVSNIVKETRIINSNSFNSLSPKMKEAVKDIFKLVGKEGKESTDKLNRWDLTLLNRFEKTVDKVCECHNIKKEDLHNYFIKEVNEQLGVK